MATIVIDDSFQTYSVNGPDLWEVASRRWYWLSAALVRRGFSFRARIRNGATLACHARIGP